MKKGLILTVLLMSVLSFAFSQTGDSWTVTNAAAWIEAVNGIRSGGNSKAYAITVTGTVSVPPITESTFGTVTGITVTIAGNGTISLSSNGGLLDIGNGQTVIAKDATLKGRDANYSPLVQIGEGGTFYMEGNAKVTDNLGGGVYVYGGTFTMKSGTISGNSGGGVRNENGTFTMQGGTISSNTISGNTSSSHGGGV
jgi:hypothetical protein